MASKEHLSIPTLGRSGEPCAACGTPLAADQRYCLNCGTRRAGLGVPSEVFTTRPTANGAEPVLVPAPRDRSNDVSPLGAVLGVALLGGMLLIGVLLGRGSDDSSQSPPSVVTVGTEQSTTPADSSPVPESEVPAGEVVSEWPPGQDGWTVELGTLAKEGTTADDVDSAKQDLVAQGVEDVGVLDSDLYPSLRTGDYVFYSGVFTTKAEATAALRKITPTVEDAQVAEVSAGAGGGNPPDAGGIEPVEPSVTPEGPGSAPDNGNSDKLK